MRLAHLAAREKRILRFDPMHEAMLDEEIERAIDGSGRHAAALRLQCGQQVVRADGTLTLRDQRVDLATQRRQRKTALGGERIGARELVRETGSLLCRICDRMNMSIG
jgi:hypothetical protein